MPDQTAIPHAVAMNAYAPPQYVALVPQPVGLSPGPTPADKRARAAEIAQDCLAAATGLAGVALIGGVAYAALRPVQAASATTSLEAQPLYPDNAVELMRQSAVRPIFAQGAGSRACGLCTVLSLTRGGSAATARQVLAIRDQLRKVRQAAQAERLALKEARPDVPDLAVSHDDDALTDWEFVRLHNAELAQLVDEAKAAAGNDVSTGEILRRLKLRAFAAPVDPASVIAPPIRNLQVRQPEQALSLADMHAALTSADQHGVIPEDAAAFAVLTSRIAEIPPVADHELAAEEVKAMSNGTCGHYVLITHEPHVQGGAQSAGRAWFAIDSDGAGSRKILHHEALPTVGGAKAALEAYLGPAGRRLSELGVSPTSPHCAFVQVLAPQVRTLPEPHVPVTVK